MYCDAVDALSRRRLHLAALALRAYVELTGALLHFDRRLSALLTKGIRNQDDMTKLHNLLKQGLTGGRFDWTAYAKGGADMERLLRDYASAKNHDDEPTQSVRQKSTGAFVEALEIDVAKRWPPHAGKVRAIYAMLSDICHPSVGGDLFFVDVPQKEDCISHLGEPHDEMVRDFVRRVAMFVLLDLSQLTVSLLNHVGNTAKSLRQCDAMGTFIAIPGAIAEGRS